MDSKHKEPTGTQQQQPQPRQQVAPNPGRHTGEGSQSALERLRQQERAKARQGGHPGRPVA